MTTYRVKLPFDRPPLTSNQRLHHQQMAKVVAEVRETVGWLARASQLTGPNKWPDHITVQLHYAPGDNRRRDPSNLMATQKPAVDGLIDAGVVPDDSPQYVTELMPVIHARETERGMWMEITPRADNPPVLCVEPEQEFAALPDCAACQGTGKDQAAANAWADRQVQLTVELTTTMEEMP